MKDAKQLFFAMVFQAAYWLLFFLWQERGMGGAANVLLAWLWLISILGLLVSFAKPVARPPSARWVKPLGWVCRLGKLALICALAWVGHIALAIVMLLVTVLFIGRQDTELGLWRKQQEAA